MAKNWNALLISLYRGARAPESWNEFLAQTLSLLGAENAFLILRRPRDWDGGLQWCSGPIAETALHPDNAYRSTFQMDLFVDLPAGTPITLDEFFGQTGNRDWRQSPFYDTLLGPWNIERVLGLDLVTPTLRASLRWTRPRGVDDFGEAEKSIALELAPHVMEALALYWQLNELDSERSVYATALNRLALGTLFVDAEGRVLHANPVAMRCLESRGGLQLQGGKLIPEQARAASQWRDLLKTFAANPDGHQRVEAMTLNRSGNRPLHLILRSVSASGAPDGAPRAVAAVFLYDPSQPVEAPLPILMRWFGFTPAEANLAWRLANGDSLEEATNALGIRRNTGRAHLRAIFAKTDVSQQSQLVSLLLRALAPLGADIPES